MSDFTCPQCKGKFVNASSPVRFTGYCPLCMKFVTIETSGGPPSAAPTPAPSPASSARPPSPQSPITASAPSSPRKPLVNILSLHIFVEPTETSSRLFLSERTALLAPDGLLRRAGAEMNLGGHLEAYAAAHPPKCTEIPAFQSDSKRARYFAGHCSVSTWYNYFEFSGLGFRYNVVIALDRPTYTAAEVSRAQGMTIEMALAYMS